MAVKRITPDNIPYPIDDLLGAALPECRSRHPYRKKNGDVFHHEIREYIL